MVSLSSTRGMLAAVRRAHSVLFTAYILRPGRVLETLEQAASRGAHVVVRLEGRPYADTSGILGAWNRRAVEALRSRGAEASLNDAGAASGSPMHMKAAVCDGVAYLDDCNWVSGSRDTVVRDDSRSICDAIARAARGAPLRQTRGFWTNKAGALAGERRLLDAAKSRSAVDVETESFSRQSDAYAALKRLAQKGAHCRLLVAHADLTAKTRSALDLLEQAGVQIRSGRATEKVAVVDSAHAWIGSANATSAYLDGDRIDWGLRTNDAGISATLAARFDANWKSASPLEPSREARYEDYGT